MSEHPRTRQTIAQIMNPRCVAFVGASEEQRKFGGRIFYNTLSLGFPGTIVRSTPSVKPCSTSPACRVSRSMTARSMSR